MCDAQSGRLFHRFSMVVALIVAFASFATEGAAKDGGAAGAIDRDYSSTIRPLLERYCYDCHGDVVTEADVNLAAFKTPADVRKRTDVWLKVRRMLDSGQMPPKDSRQPTDTERNRLKKWVRDFLVREGKARAGDPGPVVLRRLNNAEYTYAVRDLTGVASLDPTREFPVDGAAGEGFTNAGSGQGMSPALVRKYLQAAKEVADHAVLLPDGIRFSPYTSRRDKTNELLARIQAFYRRFTADGGGSAVNLQGIKFNTNQGGRLPLERYLTATLAERDALRGGQKTIDEVARERSLNARYLATLWQTLTRDSKRRPSLLIDAFREKWRHAEVDDAAALAAEIASVQETLWTFNPVGHVGRKGGPKSWMEAVSPVITRQQLRFELPEAAGGTDVVIYLTADELADGNHDDYVVWQRPRIELAAGPSGATPTSILLRDLGSLTAKVRKTIASETARTQQYLDAVRQIGSHRSWQGDALDEIASDRRLNPRLLASWAELCRLGRGADRRITGHFKEKLTRVQGYQSINGWGSQGTPSLLTNRSDEAITFLTLTVPARGVTVHPSPEREAVVAWRSPLKARIRIGGLVADADDKCGNGAAWRVELLSKSGTAVPAEGIIDNGRKQPFRPEVAFDVEAGDVVRLVVGARDGNHVCDTTHVDLKLSEVGGEQRVWDLASDVVDDVLKGNPLPDSYGHKETWHFCALGNEPQKESTVLPGSALARWRAAVGESNPAGEIDRLAKMVENLLTAENVEPFDEPDKKLRRKLLHWSGPLNWIAAAETNAEADARYGLDPAWFGKHPNGSPLDEADLCLQAPQILEVRLPSEFASAGEFVTTARLHAESGKDGSVRLRVLAEKPESPAVPPAMPILVGTGSRARHRVEGAMKEFRELFPPALCYARIVPVDEVVTLTLYYREDHHLKRLMLNERQAAELDRLWDELLYVSREPLKKVVAFEQISEFATQDRPDLVKAFAPMQGPINDRAETFRQRLVKTEPAHVQAVLELADRAWRRPLIDDERQGLRDLYGRLRDGDVPHEEAIRLLLARVLTSPAFLYKLEEPPPGRDAAPVTDWELATRLSFFLWSSVPDAQLRAAATAGRLTGGRQRGAVNSASRGRLDKYSELRRQTRRMLKDPRTRRLAIHFACQWLHLRDFDKNDDKNEKLYPQFDVLRKDMYEETVRFFEDMFRRDGSILDILEADHTFLNERLARHYGIDWDEASPADAPASLNRALLRRRAGSNAGTWRRVEGVREKGRGGILGMATFLAAQSGASRTSPILRGNWVYETLLGERLPRPPAGVPQLPETIPEGLTARQLIERHSSVAACAKCHARIDPYGFALERYDAIGRLREQKVDTKTKLHDGTVIDGIDGLRDYLAGERREDFVRQFCRKLLGYGLGREVRLSDEPLLAEMQKRLEENDYRFSVAVEAIVTSRQFRCIRGAQSADE